MGAVQALLTASGAAFLRRRVRQFRHHLWMAGIFAGLAVGCAAVTIGFLGAALFSVAEREIGPIGGALSVGALAAILAVTAVFVVRSELRCAFSVSFGRKGDAPQSASIEARIFSHGLTQLGEKPDFLQIAALVALGIVVEALHPNQHRRSASPTSRNDSGGA